MDETWLHVIWFSAWTFGTLTTIPIPETKPTTINGMDANHFLIIQKRAYFLWLAAGSPPGDGVDFWIEAEALEGIK